MPSDPLWSSVPKHPVCTLSAANTGLGPAVICLPDPWQRHGPRMSQLVCLLGDPGLCGPGLLMALLVAALFPVTSLASAPSSALSLLVASTACESFSSKCSIGRPVATSFPCGSGPILVFLDSYT